MADFDRELGDELRRRVEGYTPSPDLPARIRSRTRQRQRRRQTVVGGLAAGALAVVVGVPLALSSSSDDDESAAVSEEAATATTAVVAARAADEADEADEAATPEAAAGAATTAAAASAQVAAAAGGMSAPATELVVALDDGRVVLLDSVTGDESRTVVADTGGVAPQFDDSGPWVVLAPGCGSTAVRYDVGDGSTSSDPAWADAVAVAGAGRAVVEPRACPDSGDTYVLRLRVDGAGREVPVGAVTDLVLAPGSGELAWIEGGQPRTLDAADPDAEPSVSPVPQGCTATALAARGAQVLVAAQCPERGGSIVLPIGSGTSSQLPGLAVVDLGVDATGRLAVVDDRGALTVVEPDGTRRTLRPSGVTAVAFPRP